MAHRVVEASFVDAPGLLPLRVKGEHLVRVEVAVERLVSGERAVQVELGIAEQRAFEHVRDRPDARSQGVDGIEDQGGPARHPGLDQIGIRPQDARAETRYGTAVVLRRDFGDVLVEPEIVLRPEGVDRQDPVEVAPRHRRRELVRRAGDVERLPAVVLAEKLAGRHGSEELFERRHHEADLIPCPTARSRHESEAGPPPAGTHDTC